ncbi:NrdA Ribonucleotide reductase, alpha subunit [uncultured Caudovirales phage]|uniref:Ribonucleoside-diphosphate reductase n=1 Tax=uncultured Caudovirales phage TaxID=2100421 RepID=A0A6J5R553_9CAUD|nr:NrdA Ribonucleotide reductase, alpha subunit [uncultured Caudovirales phage]CAB4165595.1 NrdA Ribonucleotide reductase, alpha subunit [uncultured Caudovirales phage]CAB4186754.1 NrdA Ribonucleotide reductase, alpha subunit [uncultured Caudovirales phage]CAB4220702.1 NrdA Ribonucleotide reductase, alpha subunit [uncultured Caudovirales phage]
MTAITVLKRDGKKELLSLEKWQTQIAKVCKGTADVSQSMVEIKAQLHFYDGITTKEIDGITLRAIVDLIDVESNPDVGHTNYQYVAGRQRLSMLRKDVYGSYEPPHLYDIVKKNVATGLYTAELLTWYNKEEWDKMNDLIDHDKDEQYSYAAIEQLIEKYLVRNRATKEIYETPQVRYMIAAATVFHNEEPTSAKMRYIKDYYHAASDGLFTLATPVLAGLGTPTKQFSSCVLIRSDDDLDSIFASGEMMAKYASKRAGIGLEIGRLRSLGSPIRGGEIMHTGMIPFLKKWFGDLRSCSQGGIRNASATVFYPIWHHQFDDLIVLKNNQGTDETRVRHMDYGVVLSAFFWRRFKNKENITFFDPNEIPELYEAFYKNTAAFEKLYIECEKRTDLRKKVMSAEEVFKGGILKERTDTGRIYLVNIDNVQKQGPFDPEFHTIYQSNLCVEILLPTKPFKRLDDETGRIALCTLGSINWGAFRNPEDMRRVCRVLQRSLCNILDYQDFLSIQSKLSNDEIQPLGIGVTNLAYWHAKRGLKYGEADALAEVKSWMEHQAYYLTEATVEMAEERGPCLHSAQTRYGQGIFPWELRAKGVDELTNFTPEMDWETLRINMKKHGVRNATLMAIAPVESSSVVINSTNGIEMPMSLISVKESKAGSLTQVVPEYHRLKNKYQLMWDQPDCVGYLKTASVLAAYVDQSISTNTFYSPKHFFDRKVPTTLIAKNLMLAHHWGLKTIYYSLIDKQGAKAAAEETPLMSIIEDEEEVCEACTL